MVPNRARGNERGDLCEKEESDRRCENASPNLATFLLALSENPAQALQEKKSIPAEYPERSPEDARATDWRIHGVHIGRRGLGHDGPTKLPGDLGCK
jgi:hypothetical protein